MIPRSLAVLRLIENVVLVTARLYMPVMLPPGLFRLATKPFSTGSVPMLKTMGIDYVAAFAAET